MMRFTPLLFLFVQLQALAVTPDMVQVEKEYVAKCGGKTYSKCDGKEGQDNLTQETLFAVAQMSAITQRKLVFVIIGADWCGTCRALSRDFAENPALKQRLEQKYVPVNINGEVASAKALAKRLEINIVGFPQAAIYDPASNKVLERFFASSKGTTLQLVQYLETFAEKRIVVHGKDKIRASLLATPVAKPGGFGVSSFMPSTQLIGRAKDQFVRYMREGLLYFHAFHWINAARSFNSALRLERNPVGMAFLAMSMTEAETITPTSTLMIAVEAEHLSKAQWVDEEDRRFVTFAREAVASMSPEMCKSTASGNREGLMTAVDAALLNLEFTKADYLAIFAYKSWKTDLFDKVEKLEPNHGGRAHYLTHLNESKGKIADAAPLAEFFARSAPGSGHAQHMYGHILPQLGKWNEALEMFKRAHEIHQREFREEGILKDEDWHYPHNLDLLTSTMLYLDKTEEALALVKDECSTDNLEECMVAFGLYLATGRYSQAQKIMDEKFKAYMNNPQVMGLRILLELGRNQLPEATALVESLKKSDDWNEAGEFTKAAYGLITNTMTEDEMLPKITARLSEPGFDSWSVGVVESRALIRVVQNAGFPELAGKIKAIAVSAFEKKTCKTEACVRRP